MTLMGILLKNAEYLINQPLIFIIYGQKGKSVSGGLW